jgi:flagellar export protein FliJ
MADYRLQTLLEIRGRAKDAAEQAFGEAMQALAKEKEALASLEADLVRRKAERKEKVMAYLAEVMRKGIGAGGLNMMNRFEDRLKDEEAQVALEIDQQKDAVLQAEQLVEQRRVEMSDAARELKAIEKHKEGWALERKKERQMREDLAQEEIGNTLHLMRNRK